VILAARTQVRPGRAVYCSRPSRRFQMINPATGARDRVGPMARPKSSCSTRSTASRSNSERVFEVWDARSRSARKPTSSRRSASRLRQ
jgi:hypothetical protein